MQRPKIRILMLYLGIVKYVCCDWDSWYFGLDYKFSVISTEQDFRGHRVCTARVFMQIALAHLFLLGFRIGRLKETAELSQ